MACVRWSAITAPQRFGHAKPSELRREGQHLYMSAYGSETEGLSNSRPESG